MKPQLLALLGLVTVAFLATTSLKSTADDTLPLFDRKNISALWIAAPWDAKKRGPEERMQMLKELGLSKFARTFPTDFDLLRRTPLCALHGCGGYLG